MRIAIALLLLAAPLAAGCGSSADDAASGDDGLSSSEAISTSGGCNRTKVLASVTGERRAVLLRGFSWLDQNVPYSQSRSHEGYRTDCSGFVSMCWQKDRSYTTSDFVSGGGGVSRLSSYKMLLPGDALVRQGHVMLFAGWADAGHNGVCALEEASTASDMQFRVHPVSSLTSQGYKAIRSADLGGMTAPTTPAPTTPAPPPVDDTPADLPPVADTPPVDDTPAEADTTGPAQTPNREPAPGEIPTAGDAPDNTEASDQPVASDEESTAPKKKSGSSTSSPRASTRASVSDDSAGGCSIGRRTSSSPAVAAPLGLALAALLVLRRRRRP